MCETQKSDLGVFCILSLLFFTGQGYFGKWKEE